MNLSWSFQQITFENGFSANFKTVLSRRISPNWSQSKVEIGREWGGKRKREKGEGKRAFPPQSPRYFPFSGNILPLSAPAMQATIEGSILL